jgi:hypothetical protein
MPWYWTDDLARLLIDEGRPDDHRLRHWVLHPVGVRREGEAREVAREMLDEDEEPALAA